MFAQALNETIDIARQSGLEIIFRIHMSSPTTFTADCPIEQSEIIPQRVNASELMAEVLECTVSAISSRNASRGCGVGVGVCGPMPLIGSVRNAVSGSNANLAAKAGGISVHS